MTFLKQEGKHTDAPRPDLILLDLNLPKKDGLELLAEINSDEALKDIRVVILTTSEAEHDIKRSFGMDASCYLIKPIDLERFLMMVKPFDFV